MYETKQCFYCKSVIAKEATVCPYCRKSANAFTILIKEFLWIGFALFLVFIGWVFW